jgi:hypothetical protein
MSRGWAFLLLGALLLPLSLPAQQPASRERQRPEAIAETRLLMEGLAMANFRGMDRLLRQKPQENEDWVFLRGQALLIAETGNLLMLRPPRNAGESTWLNQAAELRAAGERMARAAAERNYDRTKVRLVELVAVCNRCHQTFRVPVRIPPKEEKAPGVSY